MDKNIAAAALTTVFLLGCSTAPVPPEPAADVALLAALPPAPANSIELPLEPPMVGHICKLGTSCMELDPRPFEMCLVGTRHCADKVREPLLVDGPRTRQGEKLPPILRTEGP